MSLVPSHPMTPVAREARRSNARKSTGPRTAEGKSRSRMNALKHGGYATHAVWSDDALRALGEDPAEFRKLRVRLLFADSPTGDPLWSAQVEDLARLYWRRRRLDRAFEVLMTHQGRSHSDAATLTSITPEGLPLFQQIETLDRSIDRKMRLLIRLREGEERRRRVFEREARSRLRRRLAAEGADLDDPSDQDLIDDEAELALLREAARRAGADLEDPPEASKNDSETEERTEEAIENKREGQESAMGKTDPSDPPSPTLQRQKRDGPDLILDAGQPPSPEINPMVQG